MLVLDTNVYLDADRDPEFGARLASFVAAQREPLGLSSVVVAELLAGVPNADERRRFVALTVDEVPAEYRVTPSEADWRTAGDALRAFGGEQATKGRSFWNDLLIAASCARVGAPLVTRSRNDFRRVQRTIRVALIPRPE